MSTNKQQNWRENLFDLFSGRRNDNIEGWNDFAEGFSSEKNKWMGWRKFWKLILYSVLFLLLITIIFMFILGIDLFDIAFYIYTFED